jgi:GNAT superfamily N-acetyltransferase
MIFREAGIGDINELHAIRMSVKENILSNPSLVKASDYSRFLTEDGKGWLCTHDDTILGFAIIDLKEKNIWALFVQTGYEGKGIGKKLQELMLDWYFERYHDRLWLTTGAGTRAEQFYRKSGWRATGRKPNGEIVFEIMRDEWRKGNAAGE